MRIPESLSSLVDHGILEAVVRPLMSGKEAHVYLAVAGGEERVAKVYKEAQDRTFKHRAEYTEGRRVRNSRDQRAMESRSRHGRARDEASWRSAEVDMIYRLSAAGVRVPKPYNFIDGVLIMELVKDAEGFPAPRLGDLQFSPEEARAIFGHLLAEVVRMLCAGVVHGDLSDFNVLMGADGPVIIDFPQAVNASGNQNARRILMRDVANLQRFVERFAPGTQRLFYAEEMWQLYERNALSPDTKLSGRYRGPVGPVSTDSVLSLVKDAEYDERRRREGLRISMRGVPKPQPAQGGSGTAGVGGPSREGGARGARPEGDRSRQRPQQPQAQSFQPQARNARTQDQPQARNARTQDQPQARNARAQDQPHATTRDRQQQPHTRSPTTREQSQQDTPRSHPQARVLSTHPSAPHTRPGERPRQQPPAGAHVGAGEAGAATSAAGGATKRRRRRRRRTDRAG